MPGYRLITLGGLALLDGDGRAVASLGPRILALLTYLALATKPLSRDHVAELFWGDRDEDRARHSMREALSRVRQLLGPESIPQRSNSVMLSATASAPLSVDALALVSASMAGDTKNVAELYTGPFLDSVHTGGARSFEEWTDAQRSMLESRFITACVPECARLRDAGARMECAELARRWLSAAPLDPKPALELLHALAAPGTADALRLATREYRHITERLAADFSLTPHSSVSAAADEMARRSLALTKIAPSIIMPVSVADPTDGEHASTPSNEEQRAERGSVEDPAVSRAQLPAPPSRRRTMRQRTTWFVAASGAIAGLGVLVILVLPASLKHSGAADNRSLSIMPFEVVGQTRDAWLATETPRLLDAALSREHAVSVVNVVEPARLRDMLPDGDTSRVPSGADALAAARKLRARWLLTGGVTVGGGYYWLDASLTDVRNGRRIRHVTITDTALDIVIAQTTARLVASLDIHDGGAQFAELEPNAVSAYRSYLRALQLRGQFRTLEATAALDEAIATDSGFVPAVMERRYMLGAVYDAAAVDSVRALNHAYFEHRQRATDFERLYLDSYVALHTGDHARAEALSRALLARYPRDPRAYLRAMEILSLHGRFAKEIDVAQRAIALDSAGRTAGNEDCRVCIGYRAISEAASITGDLTRAESAAWRATSLRPEDPEAWAQLGAVLSARGRYDDAVAASRRAGTLAPTDPEFALDAIRRLIEARRYDKADSALHGWQSSNDPRFTSNSAELRALLLRERGQLGAATRVLDDALRRSPADSNWLLLVQGDTRASEGDLAGAERAFVAAVPREPALRGSDGAPTFPADWARTFTWPRTLLADALWRAGSRDTVRLAALADSIQAIGARSYYARDWRLYHHVRGLIAMTGGRWPEAEAEFGKARWGRSGWTRTVVDLARAQLAQGRTTDAITTLRDAYRAQLAAMGLYVPRSELDFEMARTFAAAGAMDSARVYAKYAILAWRNADPRVRRQLAKLPENVTRGVADQRISVSTNAVSVP
jgi:DNA-binding SARP family transcriptional activator/tetratricopeptide (TPR) repeat protein